jgi:tRNA 2-thiouridine synthesizing protein A
VDAGKTPNADEQLDACGLNCPLPLLKAKQALNAMASGLVLEIVCTDPGSVRDFQVFSEQSGHKLLASTSDSDTYRYWLQKK